MSTTQLLKLIIPVKLFCPYCGARHIDETRLNEKWDRRAHTTHRCQTCFGDFDAYVSGAPDPEVPPPHDDSPKQEVKKP